MTLAATPSPARRHTLRLLLAGGAALASAPLWAQKKPAPVRIDLWKDANCGCCNDWVAHMQAHGFEIGTVHNTGNVAMRARLGLADKFGSCHTALIGGYVVEGHVPAADVQRLLREKPVALGLAVPGMPIGSPGMDGPVYGGRREAFDTLLVLRDGASRVFQHHA